jgi:hypothetical protein
LFVSTDSVITPWLSLPMTSAASSDSRLKAVDQRVADTMAKAADQSPADASQAMSAALKEIANRAWPTRADGISKGYTLMDIQSVANGAASLVQQHGSPDESRAIMGQALCDADILARTYDSGSGSKLSTLTLMATQAGQRALAQATPGLSALVLLQACSAMQAVSTNQPPDMDPQQSAKLSSVNQLMQDSLKAAQQQQKPEDACSVLYQGIFGAASTIEH